MDSILTPADIYEDKEAAKAAAAAQKKAEPKATAPAHPARVDGPPALTNPKNIADANGMIQWEDRDILAEQQMVQRVQKELDNAPANQNGAPGPPHKGMLTWVMAKHGGNWYILGFHEFDFPGQ